MKKKALALLMIVCLLVTVVPFGAFASDSSASLNLYFTDDSGRTVSEAHPGMSVWATVALSGYETLVGEADYDAGAIDKAINTAVVKLNLSGVTVAESTGAPVWDTPYSAIAENGGELTYNMNGDAASFMLTTDSTAGTAYAIDLTDLNANNGVLFRVKLNVPDTAALGSIVGMTLLETTDDISYTSIALVSKEAGVDSMTPSELAITGFDAAVNATVTKYVEEPGNYTLIDDLGGFTYSDWTAAKVSGKDVSFTTTTDSATGAYSPKASGWAAYEIRSKAAYILGKGDFTVSAVFATGSDYNNSLPDHSAEAPYDSRWYSINAAGLELRMITYSIPALYYNGTLIACGDALVAPRYEFDYTTGTLATDENGAYIKAADGEGNLVYADHAAYKKALQSAGLYVTGKKVTLSLAVEGNTATGTITFADGTSTTLLTATIPAGALEESGNVVIAAKNLSWWSSNTVYGAELISDKLIVDPFAVIDAPVFSAAEWTDTAGTKATITNTYIRSGTATQYNITHADTVSGEKFALTYSAFKQSGMGNTGDKAIGASMKVGNLYFGLNNGRMTPFVSYNGTVIYQDTKNVYEYLLTDQAEIERLNGLPITSNSGRVHQWHLLEGSNPTYTVTFDKGNFVMTFKSNNFAETEIINIDISEYVTSFADAPVSISGHVINSWDAYEEYKLVNFVYSNEAVDVGYANAVVGDMADYADYENYPDEFAYIKDMYSYYAENVTKHITNMPIVDAYEKEYEAYQTLGTYEIYDYLVKDFNKAEWTSGHSLKEIGDLKYIEKDTGTATTTLNETFNIGNEWHLNYNLFAFRYNNADGQFVSWQIGDYVVKFNIAGGTSNIVTIEQADGVVLYTGKSFALMQVTTDNEIANRYETAFPEDNIYMYYGGAYAIDYRDGVLSVSVNDTVVASAELENADFSDAEIAVTTSYSWRMHRFFDFTLAGEPQRIGLYEFNKQLADLADLTDSDFALGYSELAALADTIIPNLTEEELAVMYNVPVLEQYKQDYADYVLDEDIKADGIIYNLTTGLYPTQWSNTLSGATYVRNENYPTGGLSMEQGNSKPIVNLTYPLYTDDYFVVKGKTGASYGNDNYFEFTVGELKLRVYNSGANVAGCIVIYVYLNDVEIASYQTAPDYENSLPGADGVASWGISSLWTLTYDRGVLNIHRSTVDYGNVDLTTLDAWDDTYTPNGKMVSVAARATWYPATTFSGFEVKGRVNLDTVDQFEALAATDIGTAKNMYESVVGDIDQHLTAETIAALTPDASITAENATLVTSPVAPIYGEEVTVTATENEGFLWDGIYDANGKFLTSEKTAVGTMLPTTAYNFRGSTAVIKSSNVSLGENIFTNFYVQSTDSSVQMKFTLDGANSNYKLIDLDPDYVGNPDMYMFTYNGVAPQNMAETITAKVVSGNIVLSQRELSVAEYLADLKESDNKAEVMAYPSINNSETKYEAMITLVDDLLVYGAAAQGYGPLGYVGTAIDLTNVTGSDYDAYLTSLTEAGIEFKSDFGGLPEGNVAWKSGNLVFDSVNKIKIKLQLENDATLADFVFKCKIGDGEEFVVEPVLVDGYYYITTDAIFATGFDDVYTFNAYAVEDETTPVAYLTYSVKSYVISKQNNETVTGLKELVRALYMYGVSANAFAEAV